jgi:SAM-dependent methyltransferase
MKLPMRAMPAVATLLLSAGLFAADTPQQIIINAPYVTTPPHVVEAMIELAGLTRRDVVYDLGCGDGRIVIAAMRQGAARGVGIDLSADRVREARARAARAGVAGRIEFRRADVFNTDFHEATVVMMYLMPELNLKLRDRLRRELQPGARIVSHAFDMGDWKADRVVVKGDAKLYLWRIP